MGLNALDLRWQMVRDRWPVRVKNGSGAVIPPFSFVLNSSITTASNEIVYTIVKPNAASTDFNWGQYLVTGPFQIGAGSSAEGLATTLVQPNFISIDADATKGQVWGPKHSQWTASRYYYGYEIQGGQTTFNGIKIAVARYVGIAEVLIKNASGGDYAATSGPATYQVWNGAVGSEANTGMTLSAYNKTSIAFKDTKFGSAAQLHGLVYSVPIQT